MIVARTRQELATGLAQLRSRGRQALVPTMGYLHEGHLSLVDRARSLADVVTVSIFVNPLQFGPGEDLERYPRDEAGDLALLEAGGAHLIFAPHVKEMYLDGEPRITVDPGRGGDVLCGAWRPGHFRGVLTVVARLFGLFRPAAAVFGRKDFQQLVLIRRMVRDLELDVEVDAAPTVREEDGLAMSSRNAYLSRDGRAQAPELHRALSGLVERFRRGERDTAGLLAGLRRHLEVAPLLTLQYAEIVDAETLEPVERALPGSVAALAAQCGDTRLIDNEELSAVQGGVGA
ncbi:MAG TPA: pantoate--beta-alanine ligase [Longimicrobiales bacterium]